MFFTFWQKMVCVICLDEEVPSTITPCRVCFNVKFHEYCLEAYRRTNNVCPTCKEPYGPIIHTTLLPITQTEPSEQEEDSCVHVDMYFVFIVTQFLILIFTLAVMSRKDLFQFWTLLLTLLFMTCMVVFDERARTVSMFFRICAGITAVCTIINTVLYNHDPISIAYVGLTCMNRSVYALDRTLADIRHNRRQVHPSLQSS
jgi:hypothetical protein